MTPAPAILLVDDAPEDREATRRAFAKSGVRNPVYECAGGDEALDFLHRRGRYRDPATSPRPGLILLDLNMPGTDGHEVLADLKSDADLKTIPVLVLSSSSDSVDIEQCYRAGANSYVVKPVDLARFLEAIQRLKDYWLEVVVLPRSE